MITANLCTFYPKDLITISEIKIDHTRWKLFQQCLADQSGIGLPLHICFEYFNHGIIFFYPLRDKPNMRSLKTAG
jgi:hypothetical protein